MPNAAHFLWCLQLHSDMFMCHVCSLLSCNVIELLLLCTHCISWHLSWHLELFDTGLCLVWPGASPCLWSMVAWWPCLPPLWSYGTCNYSPIPTASSWVPQKECWDGLHSHKQGVRTCHLPHPQCMAGSTYIYNTKHLLLWPAAFLNPCSQSPWTDNCCFCLIHFATGWAAGYWSMACIWPVMARSDCPSCHLEHHDPTSVSPSCVP